MCFIKTNIRYLNKINTFSSMKQKMRQTMSFTRLINAIKINKTCLDLIPLYIQN